MANRIAGTVALVAFATCLLMGMQAGNEFETIIKRALAAMAVTFLVGWVVGCMAQKMLDESLKTANTTENPEAKLERIDR